MADHHRHLDEAATSVDLDHDGRPADPEADARCSMTASSTWQFSVTYADRRQAAARAAAEATQAAAQEAEESLAARLARYTDEPPF